MRIQITGGYSRFVRMLVTDDAGPLPATGWAIALVPIVAGAEPAVPIATSPLWKAATTVEMQPADGFPNRRAVVSLLVASGVAEVGRYRLAVKCADGTTVEPLIARNDLITLV